MTPRICPNGCGPVEGSQKFCRVCGTRLVAQVPPAPEAASVQTAELLCPNCGSANPPDKRFCRMCGTALILRTAEEIPASPSKSQAQPVTEREAARTAEQSLCPAAYPELEKPKKEPAPAVAPSVLSSTFAQKLKPMPRWVLAVALFLGAVGLVVAFFVFRPPKTTQTAVKPQGPSSIVELQQQGSLQAPIQQQVPPPAIETPNSQPSPAEVPTTAQRAPDPQVEALKRDLQNKQAELALEKKRLAEQQKALEAQRQEEMRRKSELEARLTPEKGHADPPAVEARRRADEEARRQREAEALRKAQEAERLRQEITAGLGRALRENGLPEVSVIVGLDGWVRLTGRVVDFSDRERAIKIASHYPGVTRVSSEIRVRKEEMGKEIQRGTFE